MGKRINLFQSIKIHITEILIFFLSFLTRCVFIPFCHFPQIVDEVNPLAAAFVFVGNDWKDYMIADGYYYKYGQLLLYAPIIVFVKNRIVAYRLMLVVNSLLTSFIPIIMYKICKSIFVESCDGKKNNWIPMVAFLCGSLPSILLDNLYIWSEPFQMFAFWILVYLSLRLLYAQKLSSEMICLLSMCAISIYAYMVHTRGVLLVLSSFMIALIISFLKKEYIIVLVYTIPTVAGLYVDRVLSSFFKNYVYGDADLLTGNDIGFLTYFLESIPTGVGRRVYLREIMGWIFAGSSSTWGISIIGGLLSIFLILKFRSYDNNKELVICAFWGTILYIGSLLMGTLFFFDGVAKYGDDLVIKRGDKYIYSRYLESPISMLFFIAIIILMMNRKIISNTMKYTVLGTYFALILFFLCSIYWRIDNTITWPHIFMTDSFLFGLNSSKRVGLFSTIEGLSNSVLIYSLYGLIVLIVVMYSKKSQIRMIILLFSCLFIYILNGINVKLRVDSYFLNIYKTYNSVFNYTKIEPSIKEIYLEDEIIRATIQYMFEDYHIVTPRQKSYKAVKNGFMLMESTDAVPENTTSYTISEINNSNNFSLIVVGEELVEQLRQNGYTLKNVVNDFSK